MSRTQKAIEFWEGTEPLMARAIKRVREDVTHGRPIPWMCEESIIAYGHIFRLEELDDDILEAFLTNFCNTMREASRKANSVSVNVETVRAEVKKQ